MLLQRTQVYMVARVLELKLIINACLEETPNLAVSCKLLMKERFKQMYYSSLCILTCKRLQTGLL